MLLDEFCSTCNCSISVRITLEWALYLHANVIGLLLGERGQVGAKRGQMQAGPH